MKNCIMKQNRVAMFAALVVATLTSSSALAAPTPAQQAYIKASNTGAGDWFGGAVAISGDTMVVAAFLRVRGECPSDRSQSFNSAVVTLLMGVLNRSRSGFRW